MEIQIQKNTYINTKNTNINTKNTNTNIDTDKKGMQN